MGPFPSNLRTLNQAEEGFISTLSNACDMPYPIIECKESLCRSPIIGDLWFQTCNLMIAKQRAAPMLRKHHMETIFMEIIVISHM